MRLIEWLSFLFDDCKPERQILNNNLAEDVISLLSQQGVVVNVKLSRKYSGGDELPLDASARQCWKYKLEGKHNDNRLTLLMSYTPPFDMPSSSIKGKQGKRIYCRMMLELNSPEEGKIIPSILQKINEYFAYDESTATECERIDLKDVIIPEEVINCVRSSVAQLYSCIPVRKDGETLVVAMAEISDRKVINDIEFMLQTKIKPVLASRQEIDELLKRHYGGNS